jgi:hypothetical protein
MSSAFIVRVRVSNVAARALTNRCAGRITRLSRGLHTQPARQPLCAGELNRYVAVAGFGVLWQH